MRCDRRVECNEAWEIYINAITCNINNKLILKWMVKENTYKLQNVWNHQGKQQAVANTVMNISPNKTLECIF